MAIRKHTTFQLSDDARIAAAHVASSSVTAKLSDFSFKPEPGFLYVTTRAISSRVNANYDGWPPEELRQAYRTFIGRPVYVDHNNWDLKRSRGVIIDSKLYESKLASGHEETWVQLLIEVDADAFPKLAKSILAGDIDAVSMGADVEYTICSVCSNKAQDVLQYCAHIPQMKGREVPVSVEGKTGSIRKLCYEDCYGVSFFEISFVFDPADESALISDVMLAPRTANRSLDHIIRSEESIASYSERLGTSMTKVASVKQGDKALMSLPQEVDTLRDELNCPQCGSEWNGMVCLGCGFELPPEGLGDPMVDPLQIQQEQQASGEEEEEPQDDEEEDEESNDDSSKTKKKSGTKEELRVSRFDDLQKQATLPQDPPYRQDTYPGTSAEPYGQVTPEGNQPEGVEPALHLAPAGQAVLQDLDAPDVEAPVGQSGVYVVTQPNPFPPSPPSPGITDVPPPGSQAGEALNSQVSEADAQKAASKEEQGEDERVKFYRARAAAMRDRAEQFEKKAEQLSVTDVRTLDEPPQVDVGPDATIDVLKPTQESEQLMLADTPDTINDGRETGVADVRDRLPQQFNPFNDAGAAPYGQPMEYPFGTTNVVSSKEDDESDEEEEDGTKEAAIKTAAEQKAREDQRVAAAKTRVLRVANFVDERIDMGLTRPDDKFSDIAKFEGMDDATLDGFVQATREFKAKEIKTAGRRIRVAASRGNEEGPARMPSLGSVSSPVVAEEDPADDYLTFIG